MIVLLFTWVCSSSYDKDRLLEIDYSIEFKVPAVEYDADQIHKVYTIKSVGSGFILTPNFSSLHQSKWLHTSTNSTKSNDCITPQTPPNQMTAYLHKLHQNKWLHTSTNSTKPNDCIPSQTPPNQMTASIHKLHQTKWMHPSTNSTKKRNFFKTLQ